MVNMSVADVKNCILQYVNVKCLKILVRKCKIHHPNVICLCTNVNCLETLYLDVNNTCNTQNLTGMYHADQTEDDSISSGRDNAKGFGRDLDATARLRPAGGAARSRGSIHTHSARS